MRRQAVILCALTIAAMPNAAVADVLICDFTPLNCPPATSCAPFRITIDTHHGIDAPFFAYDGTIAPILTVPEEGVAAPSFVTLGHGDREIITLFTGDDALHTRHYLVNGAPTVQSSSGVCISFD